MALLDYAVAALYRRGWAATPTAGIDLKDPDPRASLAGGGSGLVTPVLEVDLLERRGRRETTPPQARGPAQPRAGADKMHSCASWFQLVAARRREIAESGITAEQRKRAYRPWSQRLYDTICPRDYSQAAKRLATALFHDGGGRAMAGTAREDAWRVYLGLPQTGGSLDISDSAPPTSTDPRATYFCLKNRDFAYEKLVHGFVRAQRALRFRVREGGERGAEAAAALEREYLQEKDWMFGTMAEFLVGAGVDERGEYVSYCDFWDLDISVLGTPIPVELVAGWPIEFYDRIHFDRSKVERIIELEDEIAIRWLLRSGVVVDRESAASYLRESTSLHDIDDALTEFRSKWARADWDEEIRALVAELCQLDARRSAEFGGLLAAKKATGC